MARVIRGRDHRGAIEHLDLALQADPHSVDALQLRALERARLGDRGALDDAESLIKSPTRHHLYNAACALAVYAEKSGDPRSAERATQVLELALKAGFPVQKALDDPDLTILRERPSFLKLLDRYRAQPQAPTSTRGDRQPG
jgi:hypothetical protein